MRKTIFLLLLLSPALSLFAQETSEVPVITYSLNNDKKYIIADIKVTGVESFGYEDYVLIGISGLSIGDKVSVPGEEITTALRAFLKHGLFSDAKMIATKLTTDSLWLEIELHPNPLISNIDFTGVKKSEKEDLEAKIGMARGTQLTPNLINRAKKQVKDYFDEKGFSNADVKVQQRNDPANEGKVIMDVIVDKNQKTKIFHIYITGNEKLSEFDLKVAMKKTNESRNFFKGLRHTPLLTIRKLFSTRKFVREEYDADLENLITKYTEKGYRDAYIVSDSVVPVDDKLVDVHIRIEEGNKYSIRNINWVGNTLYPSDYLEFTLDMKKGDVYNLKKLNERLYSDEDAVANIYYNNGYIFSQMDPVETYLENDSVDLEIRVIEGIQATLNRIVINGNDRLYEDIIRRELVTKPGQLFSRETMTRSAREIAQMGHFDPENMDIKPSPNEETGTVDINYNLTSKANDQVEFSAGWGQTGVIGRLSLKFSNFSLNNLLHPGSYKGILPQGEGQSLTLSGQTNGRYYQSYSISFLDPWFGGKRPNNFSLSAYYMMQTGIDSRSYSALNSYGSYYSGYGYNNYGYDYGYSDYAYNDNIYIKILGVSAGYGKRLNWPDNFFTFMTDLSFQRYWLKDWYSFPISNGTANSLTFGLTLGRNSTDNPLYTRRGSSFSLSVNATPPYSLWDGNDYSTLTNTDPEMFRWIEYHKWKFKGKIFIPLANIEKHTPVLMNRIEYGFLGTYNSNKYNPFETFYMGGDGMSGYSSVYANEIVGLRGYESGSLTPYSGQGGYAYTRLALELRYPFMLEQTSTIYGLAFVEAGNAWYDIKSFNPFDLKRSAGVGVRIFLPMIGLMGIDWAYGFDKTPGVSTVSGSKIHFILGQEF
jgi:outer membrane protein insertion porin family